jgi:uncharacterized membrane protein YkvA (DUF1232 family)
LEEQVAEKKSTTRRGSANAASRNRTKPKSSASSKPAAKTQSKKPAAATKTTASVAKKAPVKKAATASTTSSRAGKRGITKADAEREAQKRARRANKYRNNPEETEKLLNRAKAKAKKNKGPLAGKLDDLMALMRMVRAYVRGEYRDVPWESIAVAIGAIIYFVSPVDAIPDVIPGVGYIDDAAVIAFVVVSIQGDLEEFREWEAEQELG